MNKDSTDVILESSRFWVQKVLVPIMVCMGVTGNTITVMVLTRRRMRSSTNIYLSALAIADIIYLFFVFLLSFKHYSNIHDTKYALYWRFYGISHWLCDAASSTSVWLTVSFTIERYIAVCHPMKGKFLCTESRAKTVTVIVYIFCLLTTASTTFEYQLYLNDTEICWECRVVPKHTAMDNSTSTNTSAIHYVPNNFNLSQNYSTIKVVNDPHLTNTLKNILANCTTNHAHIIYVYPQVYNVTPEKSTLNGTRVENLPNITVIHHRLSTADTKRGLNNSVDGFKTNETSDLNLNPCCDTKWYIDVESTNLGKNKLYTTIMYWYSALFFGLFPLVLIATFNCFLIRVVYLSQKKRRTMTNSKSNHVSQENASMSNENRITLMLIAVVVLFLTCQTPTASFLIYYVFYPPKTQRQINIQGILGNVFNFLFIVNSSCNFLLYSIMSKKYRSTFKQLFFERGKNKRQDTMVLSSTQSNNPHKFNPYHHGIKRNASEYHTPRNLETTSLTGIPRSKSLMARPIGKTKSTDLIV